MVGALTAPVLTAAGLLVVSGAAKLRSPGPAATALAVAGLPWLGRWPGIRALFVRCGAVGELALGGAGLLVGGKAVVAVLAAAYAGFAALTWRLARRRAACGCFGEADAPATGAQAGLSLALAAVCLAAVRWTPGTLAWILGRPPVQAATLTLALAGCVYGAVTAYTQLPAAWTAWSGR